MQVSTRLISLHCHYQRDTAVVSTKNPRTLVLIFQAFYLGDAKSKLPKLWLGFIAECLRRAAGNLYMDSSKNKLNGLIDAILHGTGQGKFKK